MWKIGEFKSKNNKLSDWLCWACLVAEGVILNKDGSFQTTFSYRGADLDSSTEEELMATVARLNNSLRRFGGEWCLYAEAKRKKSLEYPDKIYPDKVTQLIDNERRFYFQQGDHYESKYYFTLLYLPPEDKFDKFEKILIEKVETVAEREDERVQLHLKNFLTETDRVFYLLKEIMPACYKLNDDETLTYLHSCISPKEHYVKTPSIPMFLDSFLADTPLRGGLEPKLGDYFISAISIIGFPQMSNAGILDELNRMNFEYRWVTRYIPLDKLDASKEIGTLRREWFAKRKSLFTMLKETITRSESAMVDTGALEKFNDAQAALRGLDDDFVNFGYFTSTIIILNKDNKELEKISRIVEKTINGKGFTTITESLNAVSAWFGSIPGMARANIRKPMINSMNLAHMFPISSVWAGQEENKHLKAPVLLTTQTTGSTPFRLSFHVGDVGHTMIVGPTGSGKSVLLNTIEAQFRGYKDSQIYIFDKGGSSRVLTAGVGGEFYDLAAEEGNNLSFQPLANVDDEKERMWAMEWILQMLLQEGIEKITPEIKQEVWNTLNKLAAAPKNERTMTGFYLFSQNKEIRIAIQAFTKPSVACEGGAYGSLFDNEQDNLSYGNWQTFEMEELMNKKGAVMPTLNYIFHRLEQNCKGKPTIFVLDECWVFLDNPLFAEKIREWLKVMRKNNVSIIFATQNLEDVANSKIAPAIIESCLTRIFLPNPAAINDSNKEIYKKFDLNKRERSIIALSTPKRQYYYKSTLGSRLFELALGKFALAYVASASKEDQRKCKDILMLNKDNDNFNQGWLEYKQLEDCIDEYNKVEIAI